jgi:predicted nuclease with TOPRIM domain
MKSAYELAMERLSKADPISSSPVTPEQRKQLAEIDRLYQGKIAEREIFLRQQLERALATANAEEVDKIRKQISSEKSRLEEDRETEKDRVRSGKA